MFDDFWLSFIFFFFIIIKNADALLKHLHYITYIYKCKPLITTPHKDCVTETQIYFSSNCIFFKA